MWPSENIKGAEIEFGKNQEGTNMGGKKVKVGKELTFVFSNSASCSHILYTFTP